MFLVFHITPKRQRATFQRQETCKGHVEGRRYEICFVVNHTQGKALCKKMCLVNGSTNSLLDSVRSIQKEGKAKPKINLRRFEGNFPEQMRVQPLNQVTNLNRPTCLVSLSSNEFVNSLSSNEFVNSLSSNEFVNFCRVMNS